KTDEAPKGTTPAPPKTDEASKGPGTAPAPSPLAVTIIGVVTDVNSQPVEGASVWLTVYDGQVTAFSSKPTKTNEAGAFECSAESVSLGSGFPARPITEVRIKARKVGGTWSGPDKKGELLLQLNQDSRFLRLSHFNPGWLWVLPYAFLTSILIA